MNDNLHDYALRIDGPLLADQRRLLLKVMDTVFRGEPYVAETPKDEELLQGLMSLLDEIADQAHDRYGIESLIKEQPPAFDDGQARHSRKMFVLHTSQGVPALETVLCEGCYKDAANIAYAKEQGSHTDDVENLETFHACPEDLDVACCICDRTAWDAAAQAEESQEPWPDNQYHCECERPGCFCSGLPGILAHVENGHLAEGSKVERCDLCCRYPSDVAALEKLQELGIASK